MISVALATIAAALFSDDEWGVQFESLYVKKGARLFHGTRAPDLFEKEYIEGPFWVANTQRTAEWFVDYHEYHESEKEEKPRIIEFEATEDIGPLILIRGPRELEDWLEHLGADAYMGINEMAEVTCERGGVAGWFTEDNYMPGDHDIMICNPDSVLKVIEVVYL